MGDQVFQWVSYQVLNLFHSFLPLAQKEEGERKNRHFLFTDWPVVMRCLLSFWEQTVVQVDHLIKGAGPFLQKQHSVVFPWQQDGPFPNTQTYYIRHIWFCNISFFQRGHRNTSSHILFQTGICECQGSFNLQTTTNWTLLQVAKRRQSCTTDLWPFHQTAGYQQQQLGRVRHPKTATTSVLDTRQIPEGILIIEVINLSMYPFTRLEKGSKQRRKEECMHRETACRSDVWRRFLTAGVTLKHLWCSFYFVWCKTAE